MGEDIPAVIITMAGDTIRSLGLKYTVAQGVWILIERNCTVLTFEDCNQRRQSLLMAGDGMQIAQCTWILIERNYTYCAKVAVGSKFR